MDARFVDFSGWEMPLHYGSQLNEHHQVRKDAGMFDVSHMMVVDIRGEQARPFLQHLLANNVGRLKEPGKALYSCMLNEQGGVIDDLIVYYMQDDWFRMVVNAGTRDKDMTWMQQQASAYAVTLEERTDLSMIAVQGPHACTRLCAALEDDELCNRISALSPFYALETERMFVGRTGYTGEDGFEIVLPNDAAPALWRALHAQGVAPIGLGARDTLRLEAGMNLYGADMDEATTPLESALGWTVAWEPQGREFIGREALERQRTAAPACKLVGLVLEGRGVLRNHQKVVVSGLSDGEITSGSYAPTLNRSIAFARVPAATGASCSVEIRGKMVKAVVVKPPFVRNGNSCLPDSLH